MNKPSKIIETTTQNSILRHLFDKKLINTLNKDPNIFEKTTAKKKNDVINCLASKLFNVVTKHLR